MVKGWVSDALAYEPAGIVDTNGDQSELDPTDSHCVVREANGHSSLERDMSGSNGCSLAVKDRKCLSEIQPKARKSR